MWNPFKKSKTSQEEKAAEKSAVTPLGMPEPEKMNMLQRFAYKRFMAMNPQEQKKMAEKMITPENIAKHKDEIIAQLEQARKNGQMSDDQYRLAKKKFGL